MRHALLLASLLLASSAYADEQSRDLPGFKTIKSKSAFNLSVEVGKPQSIVIKGNEKFIATVSTEVIGDELIITSRDKHNIKISDSAQVIITVPELTKVKMEGVGATSLNKLSGPRFELYYEGVGKLEANGKVKAFTLRAQGVGLVDTKDLQAEQVDVRVEGVGAVKVNASDSLRASVQGIGSLTYYGHPRTVSRSVDGIGSVSAAD